MRVEKSCNVPAKKTSKEFGKIERGTLFRHSDGRNIYLKCDGGRYVSLNDATIYSSGDLGVFDNYIELPKAFVVTGEE